MPQQLAIRLTINGQPFDGAVAPRLLLSDFLRENVGLSGVRVCCEQGICGACTILFVG
jgi:carbon-monoxide dehydrogenase small subunit